MPVQKVCTVSAQVPDELEKSLRKAALSNDLTVSQIIRAALRQWLAHAQKGAAA